MVAKMTDLTVDPLSSGNSFNNLKIPGDRLVKIFDDSYEKMKDGNFDPEHDFPPMCDGRSIKTIKDLILTALLVYKQGHMNVQEISNIMDLYKKFTMKKTMVDGSIREQVEFLVISQYGILEELIKAMSYINRTINPAFVRDWCLKCCRHLESTRSFFMSNRSALNSNPILFKNPNTCNKHKIKVMARHVLE